MERPVAVKVFGILNIVFGAVGIIGTISSAVMVFGMKAQAAFNPMVKIMQENPTYAAWMKLNIPLGLIATVALLASGIGLLMLKPWSRPLALGYAVYAIVAGFVNVAMTTMFLVLPTVRSMSPSGGPEAAGAIGGAIGGAVGGVLALVYPILMLIFLTRPNVVAAFRPARPASSLRSSSIQDS